MKRGINTNNQSNSKGKALSILSIVLFAVVVAMIITMYSWVKDFQPDGPGGVSVSSSSNDSGVPDFLERSFPSTDFSGANLSGLLSGGVSRDGIPALSNPEFIAISETTARDEVLAIVIEKADGQRRAYPYNILNWHEIVNDEVDGVPIAVTFCPLCGSAVVYNRTIPAGVSEFGVSGALIESNMVMYDRLTESLWQQSTGVALAGVQLTAELEIEPFQLLSVGDIKANYLDAEIMSENINSGRDYDRNPYSGYDEDDSFIFNPSVEDTRFPLKEIFAVATHEDISVALQWLELENGIQYLVESDGASDLTVTKTDGELLIVTETGEELPFYFEMWFSWAVQHQDTANVTIFSPSQSAELRKPTASQQ